MAMKLTIGKRVQLKSSASGKNVRARPNDDVDALGGDGQWAKWDVVKASQKGAIMLRNVENPNIFLCVREDGVVRGGQGGKQCEFKLMRIKKTGEVNLRAVHMRKENAKGKVRPGFVGFLPNGKCKDAFKTRRGKHGRFVIAEIGDSEPEEAVATRAGSYYTKRAGDVDAGSVAIDPERKKALLVGCNYPRTNAALAGCVNDVWNMKDVLIKVKGFKEKNIRVLIDTDASYERPTGRNIKLRLQELIRGSKAGDVLFFHFSGHGTQVPAEGTDRETDRKDEALVPTDMNLIVDDDLRRIVEQVPHGVALTVVTDCCHSGGMLDHQTVQIGGGDIDGSGSANVAGSHPSTARELPIESVVGILSDESGHQIAPHHVKRGLFGLFGASASNFCTNFISSFVDAIGFDVHPAAPPVNEEDSDAEDDDDSDDDELNETDDLFSYLFGAPPAVLQQTEPPPPAQAVPPPNLMSLFGASTPEEFFTAPLPEVAKPELLPTPGTKPGIDEQLPADKGLLISGCQSSQTSADVRSSDGSAYGALSNMLGQIIRSNRNISAKQLVEKTRTNLGRSGFSQRPGLESSDYNAAQPFICPDV